MPEKITGPFGFWTFPILNTIISIFSARSLKSPPLSRARSNTPEIDEDKIADRVTERIKAQIPPAIDEDKIADRVTERIKGGGYELYSTEGNIIPPPIISNEEQWSWIDYKGNKREITVHRKVKAS